MAFLRVGRLLAGGLIVIANLVAAEASGQPAATAPPPELTGERKSPPAGPTVGSGPPGGHLAHAAAMLGAKSSGAERFLVASENVLAQATARVGSLAAASGEAASASLAVLRWITAGGSDPGAPYRAIGIALVAVFIGWIARRVATIAVSRLLVSSRGTPTAPRSTAAILAGLVAFIAAAWATPMLLPEPAHAVRMTSHAVMLTFVATWGAGMLATSVLWPSRSGLEVQARRATGRIAVLYLSFAILFGSLVGLALLTMAGVSSEARLLLAYGSWFVFAVLAFGSQAGRNAGSETELEGTVLPRRGNRVDRLFSRFGPALLRIYAGVVVLAAAVLAPIEGTEAFWDGTISLVLGLALAILLDRTLPRDVSAPEDGGSPWGTLRRRGASLVYVVGFLAALALVWEVGLFSAASDRLGEGLVRAVIDVAITLAVAYLVWELIRTALDQSAFGRAASPQGERGEEGGGPAATRLQTFGPVLRNFLFASVLVVAAMVTLSSLGIDIVPLLAGAGVVGIAVAFGAQALVRDILSGIFFLADDAFRLGEYIEIGTTRGTVEGISIRSLKLRHHRGPVHTVPFGEIKQLTNHSRDWVIVKLEFLLAFDTDLRKVKRLVKEIGRELEEDPELGASLLEPAKSQGVRRMEPNGMVVGIKFMAKPGEQFVLRREIYQRVRDAFDRNGIHFARPQVVVAGSTDATGAPSDAQGAAALEAAKVPAVPPA